jgi:hypothetical protein
MNTFRDEDVVTFVDGKRILRLWDRDVEVEYVHVLFQEGDQVTTALYNEEYVFNASELVKLGEMYDTELNEDGKERFKWIDNDEDL